MLPKASRLDLRHYPDFWRTARKAQTPLFTIFFHSVETSTQPAQFAVVVPKHVFVKATHRNRAKRWLRSALSPLLLQLKGFNVVIKANRVFSFSDLDSLQQKIREICDV